MCHMVQNESTVDRIIRGIVGIILVIVGAMMSGWIAIVLMILGVVMLLTGATGFCGLYALLGIHTRKNKEQ